MNANTPAAPAISPISPQTNSDISPLLPSPDAADRQECLSHRRSGAEKIQADQSGEACAAFGGSGSTRPLVRQEPNPPRMRSNITRGDGPGVGKDVADGR